MSTSYNTRAIPTTNYWARTDVYFLMTQSLDFLMTQDDNYIVLQNSYTLNTQYNTRPII